MFCFLFLDNLSFWNCCLSTLHATIIGRQSGMQIAADVKMHLKRGWRCLFGSQSIIFLTTFSYTFSLFFVNKNRQTQNEVRHQLFIHLVRICSSCKPLKTIRKGVRDPSVNLVLSFSLFCLTSSALLCQTAACLFLSSLCSCFFNFFFLTVKHDGRKHSGIL